MYNLTPIVEALFALLGLILTYLLIPFLKSRISADQLAEAKMWATIAVQAAKQLYIGSGKGREKKEYVLKFLESKGFKLDADSIDNLIESSVLELKKAIE